MLEELNFRKFPNENKKVHFIMSKMNEAQKNKVKNCFDIEELFQCLDAHNSAIHPAIRKLYEKLQTLPHLPDSYSQEENKNIQEIIHFLRILRKNEMKFDWLNYLSVRSLLSKENCMKLIEMGEEEDLTTKDFQNFLYERYSINTQIIDSRRQSRGEEKKLLDVSAKQKPSVPPWIQSKLSRIRKKFYLNCDIDTATVYSLEVQRAARHFTMTPAETQKWKKRIEKTFNDVKPLVVEENNSKDVEKVPPMKDEEDNKEKISDIGVPSTRSGHAKQYAALDKSGPCRNNTSTDEEKEEKVSCEKEDDETEPQVSKSGNTVDIKHSTDEELASVSQSGNTVGETESRGQHKDFKMVDPKEEAEIILPDVPKETPGNIDHDPDEILRKRLSKLKANHKQQVGVVTRKPYFTTEPVTLPDKRKMISTATASVLPDAQKATPDQNPEPDDFFEWLDSNTIPATKPIKLDKQVGEPENTSAKLEKLVATECLPPHRIRPYTHKTLQPDVCVVHKDDIFE